MSESSAAETVHEIVTEAEQPRRSRRKVWLTLSLVAVVVAVSAFAAWEFLGRDRRSPEAVARDDLHTAQVALLNAPGAHYSGRYTEQSGKTWTLDLRVTNMGDASGTIEIAPGKLLSLLEVGGKVFLRGDRDTWIADGFNEVDATAAAGRQILEPARFSGVDLAGTLTPGILGSTLDPNDDKNAPVQVGASEMVDDRLSALIVSGTVADYVYSGQIDRIIMPNFDIKVAAMNSDDVVSFYRDLRPAVAALDDASDTETVIKTESSWSSVCGPTCSVLATLTSTPHPFTSFTLPSGYTPPVHDILVSYQVGVTVDDIPVPTPDCTGVISMPGAGTGHLSCAFSTGSGSRASSDITVRAIVGRARADELLHTFDDDTTKSKAKLRCPTTSIHGLVTTPGC